MATSKQLELTAFETALLEALLEGEAPLLETLREQFRHARILEREFSGAGFFLHFEVPHEVPQTDPPRFHLGDVHFESEQIPLGGEAILFIRDGRMDFLEVFSHDGSWAPEVRDFSIHYFSGTRDLDGLLASLQGQG